MDKIKQQTPVLTMQILDAETTLLLRQQNFFPSD
jgi:hypothetical protein